MGAGATENSPIDRLRGDIEAADAATKYQTEDDRAANRKRTREDVLDFVIPRMGDEMVRDIAGAQTWPGVALQTGLAGLEVLGVGAPVAGAAKAAKGAASRTNIFVGPEAKTANLDKLAQAKEMQAKGLDRDTIWKDTGWAFDEKGLPYFEIDDSASVFGTKNRNPKTVGEVIKHPELFTARPDLEQLAFRMEPRLGEGGGNYGRPGLEDDYPQGSITLGNQSTVAKAHGTTIHELQHGADYERGASYGASYSSPSPADLAVASDMLRSRYGEAFTAWEDAVANYQAALRDTSGKLDPRRAMDAVDAAEIALAKAQGAKYATLPKDIAYTNNPGEARARNADTRMGFNAAERQAIPPWHTLDVDEADILANASPFAEAKPQIFVNADDEAAKAAREMRQADVPLPKIWKDTGRLITPAGSVKREIPDTDMRVKLPPVIQSGDAVRTGDVVDHPALFDAFPWLADKPLELTTHSDSFGQPVARITDRGAFSVNPALGAERPLAKLFQYEVNKAERGPVSIRHGVDAADRTLSNATRNAQRLPGGDAVDAYLRELGLVREQFNERLARESGGRGYSRAADKFAGASAGNFEARMTAQRADPKPGHDLRHWPYGDQQQFTRLTPYAPETFNKDELLQFIEQWRAMGAGKNK